MRTLKSQIEYAIDELVKSGAGSRGGIIIGHTRSGKPIYESHDSRHHNGFTDQDHHDAHRQHTSLAREKIIRHNSLEDRPEIKAHKEYLAREIDSHKQSARAHRAKTVIIATQRQDTGEVIYE